MSCTLLRCLSRIPSPASPGVVPIPQPDQGTLDEIRGRLDEVAARVRSSGVECVPFSSIGGVPDETGIRRVLLGSVGEEVLRKAHRPVLIVPPPREAAT
jgi:hypothetical protein